MNDITFKVCLNGITSLECFKDASKDELKVLVAIASLNGKGFSAEELACEIGVSRARVMAAIALFEEQGVLNKSDDMTAEIEYEFEPKKNESSTKLEIADYIKYNEELGDLHDDIMKLFGKTLAIREIERIQSLYKDKGLSAAYIIALTTFVKESSKTFTVEKVVREANRLVEKKITTLEELEIYIQDKSNEVAGEWELVKLLGIKGRALTKSEREYFKKWLHDFGYAATIIGEAYDITIGAIDRRSMSYMDKILTEWHEVGCKTLEECRAKASIRKHEKAKTANKGSQKNKKSVEAETPKYTDFNSEDALMRALERSYGDGDEN